MKGPPAGSEADNSWHNQVIVDDCGDSLQPPRDTATTS
jgi:hypothetical protein